MKKTPYYDVQPIRLIAYTPVPDGHFLCFPASTEHFTPVPFPKKEEPIKTKRTSSTGLQPFNLDDFKHYEVPPVHFMEYYKVQR